MSSSTWRPPAPVSIFVSSTFRDMQLERDAIRDRVLPRLEELAAHHGTTVSIVDLRWGIDTTGIDEAGQEELVRIVREERARGAAIVLSSHDAEFLSLVCDRIYHMSAGSVTGEEVLHVQSEL